MEIEAYEDRSVRNGDVKGAFLIQDQQTHSSQIY